MRIANCTTAAQYFHLLRRQAALLLTDPLPLIVLTPKSLLRHPLVASTPRELAEGRFRTVIDDDEARTRAADVRRVLVCTGKVYVDLAGSDARAAARDIAIVPRRAALSGPGAEPARDARRLRAPPTTSSGCRKSRRTWARGTSSVRTCVEAAGGRPVRAIARPRSASPAEGSAARHARQQQLLIEAAFAPSRNAGRAKPGTKPAPEQVAG